MAFGIVGCKITGEDGSPLFFTPCQPGAPSPLISLFWAWIPNDLETAYILILLFN